MHRPRRHRVVVIGGGFGGLAAVKALRRAPVEVTLVDRQTHHLFQPLLYHVATGILSEGNISAPLRDVLRHQRNAQVALAEVTGVDVDRRSVKCTLLDRTWDVAYDSLIVAAGSAQSYFGYDEFSRHAPGMKTIDDALEVRGRIFGAFELAELEEDPARRTACLTFVVVGAGPTGVEMAGQIAELSRRSVRSNFKRIDTAEARIVLVDRGPRILAAFDERLSRKAVAKLEHMGVEIRTGTAVSMIDATGVELTTANGIERLAAMTKIWSAGVQASPLGAMLAAQAGAEPARSGQVAVAADCTLPGHPEVFVVGDLMALEGLPGLAEAAMQSGRHAATEIRRRLSGDLEPRPLRYRDLGSLAAVSRYYAIGQRGRARVSGFTGWLLWLVVHLTFLTGFKNRVSALFHWIISFFGRSRPERTITAQQIFAREALATSAECSVGPSVADGPTRAYHHPFEREVERRPGRVAMTTSDKLMDASQRLAKLSERAKEAEDHAAVARNQAKADVEKSADKARAAAEAHAQELRKTAAAAGAQISASRNDMQESLANHMAQMRQSIDEKKGHLDAKRAESRADDAEVDALFAIDYAYATVEEAEYAVLDAISARMEADDLALSR